MKRRVFFFLIGIISCLWAGFSHAQSFGFINEAGNHRGAVRSLLSYEPGLYISAGEDGFAGIWSNQAALDRFQLSPYGVKSMTLRPGKDQAAVIEDDGFSIHRVSAWDHKTRANLFTLNFIDSVSFINYSAAGKFLIAGLSGQNGVTFIDAETGKVSKPLANLSDQVVFAATSMSERVIICYSSTGILSYWDIETGAELRRFVVPPNISSPVLFGNNCFMGGFDPRGLVIVDVVTGTTLARDDTIRGIFFIDESAPAAQERAQFYCLVATGLNSRTILRMEINQSGRLAILNRISVPQGISDIVAAASGGGGNFIFGTGNGNLWLLNGSRIRLIESKSPELILDLASSAEALGFITANGLTGFLPLDYSRLRNGDTLRLEDASAPAGTGAYTRISSDSSVPSGTGNPVFLYWENSRSIPMLKTLRGTPLGATGTREFLENLPLAYPIRSASMLGNRILFLNSQGTISIINRANGSLQYSYTAAGAQDAAFFDLNSIIIGRSAVTGNTPFLMVNTITGETVPLNYPAMLGLKVFRGSSGAIYGAAVDRAAPASMTGEIKTSVIRLNTSNPSQSEKLDEYGGEDSSVFIIESGANPASNLGGGAAVLYRNIRTLNRNQSSSSVEHVSAEHVPAERSRGLPQKAADGGARFVILDGEGGICWHDNRTGKLLAVFNLYRDHWILEAGEKLIRGAVIR